MLSKIIQFSIRNKPVIGLLIVGLIIWGSWSATQLPLDAVPDITNNQVQIITLSPRLATQEVEQFVTYPIEKSLANLPDLEEIRSISRFGLSVVTVVFKESVGTYLARQLISERLKEAESQIPPGMGTPELAPVSTGLGQIYEYVIHPIKGREQAYSPSDLRTMQDWVVARQLYGTPGVAEVNSFGGSVKQYEVAVNPDRLKALNVSIPEIFSALEKNNQNTGGAYIDKRPNAYYIRGIGLITSLEDIGKIAIKKSGEVPVLISDVAQVGFGSAVRYGSLTRNGDKEVVGGIVMMLKGANSGEVTSLVKAKLKIISQSLPEDVTIEPYLDRTQLVNRAISTVERNLIEGALIVIFVLILFLGNVRAGLIVASAIPLALLFALGLMNVFGVSANLMSLGAIDFGLIVDGAVIIVESILHRLSLKPAKEAGPISREHMDQIVAKSAHQMMNSAVFGQIIILIVYLPVLFLRGIEGKMFRPMAETVSFAILGAILLSLTYIPMMSALFLPKKGYHKVTVADRLMNFFHRIYSPVLWWAIRIKYAVVGVALIITIFAIYIFMGMGGEFIPQLEEGDFAFEFVMPQGTSLSQSSETAMLASRMIKQFPEVKEVIAKTGSAEIPTDPMPPEATDMMIILKDKKDWVTTHDYNELAALMVAKLENIPGVSVEASQPIQMRFNELMTGVKQDVAVKIFGENIDTLSALAPIVAAEIQSVRGTTEPKIERMTGLSQITITYDRDRIAGYGLNIEDINTVVSTAFAGKAAGVVFENERRFDLVVRLDSAHRTSIEDVAELYIPTGHGNQIPLRQVATVQFKEGPAQISREDAKRRVVIGFNVRNRDVQSVVSDIQTKLNTLKLPSGYFITYGGAFENLEKASAKLKIAVPAALGLIFVMLCFTFHSTRQATIIFTAIPMAAIGGIFALLLRDMPFSISAGIGFIALFGVAVLNGIVLIATFNQLEKEGMTDVVQIVRKGTSLRLRPVLVTATVASLGFLPMALSSGAGAEVQKPLATVVIGGLISATILTLWVLPLLYIIFNKMKGNGKIRPKAITLLVLLGLSPSLFSQRAPWQNRITFEAAYDTALVHNLQLHAVDLKIEQSRAMEKTGIQIPKTGFFAENEDLNPEDPNGVLKMGISQSIEWPGVYKARKKVLEQQSEQVVRSRKVKALEIKKELQSLFYNLWYLQDKQRLWKRMDSMYTSLSKAAVLKVRTGQSAGLDSIAALAKAKETTVYLQQLSREILIVQRQLQQLLHTPISYLPPEGPMEKVAVLLSDSNFSHHPLLQLQQQEISITEADIHLTRQSRNPDFEGRFFSQQLYGVKPPYSGFSVTMGIPLLGRGFYKNKIKAAQLESSYQKAVLDAEQLQLETNYYEAIQQMRKNEELLMYYETTGILQAGAIEKAADISYRAGEISFAELTQFLSQALDIQKNYLEVLHQFNQSVIQLNYYLNRS